MPTALTIAGFDPSGGAGVLADIKTFAAHGVYGMACVTALTVQSTQGVRRVEPLTPLWVRQTLECLTQDVRFSVVKVGMLGSAAVAEEILTWLCSQPELPVVLDPVLRSSSGVPLLEPAAMDALKTDWLGRVNWVTPNLAEAAELAGCAVPADRSQVEACAASLQARAASAGNAGLGVVITGGHAPQPDDYVFVGDMGTWLPGKRILTSATHGTGCTFSAALAAGLARGTDAQEAVRRAKQYVTGAIQTAERIGQGKGPLNHLWSTVTQREP
jgi:hydroxymethylpyrimidine/phosphomethylpyrimidine kinase